MKINIIAQMKSIYKPILRDIPAFGDAGFDLHAVADLHEAVVELVVHPDGILVAAEGRVQRGEALVQIDIEDRFAGWTAIGMTGRKREQDGTQKADQFIHYG